MIRDQRTHVEHIRNEFQASQRVKDSLNNSIQALAADLYSKETHFIFELIQNAEDNTYKETEPFLSFQLVKTDPTNTKHAVGALIIQNNEIGFSSDNVDAICAVGKTTKNKTQGYIGEKGIGFKSVFRITTTPHIISGGYQFCLPEKDEESGLGYIVPRWVEKPLEGIDYSCTSIIIPLDKPDFGYEIIEKMLQDIEPETIIFLSKLKKIQVKSDTVGELTILKDDTKAPLVQISTEIERQGDLSVNKFNFLLHTKSFDKPDYANHEKRVGIDRRDVSIAFPLDENKESAGKIFAYLPVRTDTGLPFLINADFILPSSREEIRGNVPWNEWLMKCVATLIVDTLSQLKDRELLTVNFLEVFAKRMNELVVDENGILYPVVDVSCKAFLERELLPTDEEGMFVSAKNSKLARGSELRELISSDHLEVMFCSENSFKWLSGDITQDKTPNLRLYLMSEQLNVDEIRAEKLIQLITDDFLEARTDDWFVKFYNFLGKGKLELWKKDNSILRRRKILRLEDNSNVIPFHSDGRPNAYLPSLSKTNFPTIKRTIFSNKGAEEFLRDLGLVESDLFAEVIEFVLPKYAGDSICSVDFQKNVEDLRKIRKLMTDSSQIRGKDLIGKLKILALKLKMEFILEHFDSVLGQTEPAKLILTFMKFMFNSIKFISAVNHQHEKEYKTVNEVYLNSKELWKYFEGSSTTWFVDDNYPVDLEPLFKELSIECSPRVQRSNVDINGYIVIDKSRGWHRRALDGFDPDIEVEGLENALKHPTVEKSSFIWNRIVIENVDCIRGVVEFSTKKTYENSDKNERLSKKFGQLLVDNLWLPDNEENFYKPSDLGIDNLPTNFQRNEKLVISLGMKKDIVAMLAEEAGVSAEDLEFMKQYAEEFKQWRADISAKNQKSTFPERASADPERRQERLAEQMSEAPEKKYEKKQISVRTTAKNIDPIPWLRNQYTDESGQMFCQICKKEMPFKKRNGEYHFEKKEMLSSDYFTKEHEAQYLALCPLCAAMYFEFVLNDKIIMESLKNTLMQTAENFEVHLRLGILDTSIRFIETHYLDIKTIINDNKLGKTIKCQILNHQSVKYAPLSEYITNESFVVNLTPAFIKWGGLSVKKSYRNLLPPNHVDSQKNEFTINILGYREIKAWMSQDRIKIPSSCFREMIDELGLDENSTLTFKIMEPFKYYKASKA